MATERRLEWPQLLNVRDLGGLPAGQDAVRWRALIRAESLNRLTEAGWAALEAYGVSTIIDLRAPIECRQSPGPLRGGIAYLNLPLLDDVAFARVNERYDVDGANYLWQLDHRPPGVGAILTAVAGAPPGAVLVHCAAGKDRTGLIVALLLTIAGVDRSVIAADYALSADALRPILEEELAAERDRSRRERLCRMYQSRPETMTGVLAELDSRYGRVAGYLQVAGVGRDVQNALQRRLLEGA